VLSVKDTGPGIAQERQEAIFLEFEQEDASTGLAHGGTGLGLAIVRRLTDAMGGAVSLASVEGEGSTFEVTLPLDVAEAAPAADLPLRGRRLLILSPSRFTAEAIAGAARAAGAEATISTAVEFTPALQDQFHPDSIIIDYALGAEEAATIRRSAEIAGIARRLVLISPQERRSLGRPADAGFTGHLVRPVRAKSLIDTLSRPSRRRPAADAFPARDVAAPAGVAPGLRVLLAEDNDINAMIALRMLEREGVKAVWARDGRAALGEAGQALAAGEPFDLVLMDVRMPEMDGLAATRAIRAAEATHAPARRIPILGISANVAEEDVAEALAAGMDDCLPKPIDRPRLIAWLRRIADERPASQAA
jgi:CheY-like chemotaxis protein